MYRRYHRRTLRVTRRALSIYVYKVPITVEVKSVFPRGERERTGVEHTVGIDFQKLEKTQLLCFHPFAKKVTAHANGRIILGPLCALVVAVSVL